MEQQTQTSVETRHTVPQRINWFPVLVLLGSTVYLYLNLFAFPHTPFLLAGNQVFFWMDAQRMLDGGRIYRDFLQFTPPGTDLLYAALFQLFGFHIWVTNAVVLALGVAFCWLCFSLASEITDRRSALLATALFLVIVYGKSLDGTHQWFSMLAVMCAIKIAFRRMNSQRIALAGALLGVASFFNQTYGAAALLAFVLFLLCRPSRTKRFSYELLKNQALLLLGFAIVLLVLTAHFISTVGLKQLWYFQVTYVTKYVIDISQGQLLGLPEPLTWRTLPRLSPYLAVYISLPVVYVATLWRCWRERNNPSFPWDRVALLSIVGLLLLAEVSLSLNWLRLYTVSLPGIILLPWTLDQASKFRRYAAPLIWVGVICLAVLETRSRHVNQLVRAELPGGRVATTPQKYDKLRWIMLRTKPGDFFFHAGWPGLYLPLQLRNPLPFDTMNPVDASGPQVVEQAIQQLQAKHVQYILWTRNLDAQCDPDRRCEDYLTPLRDYLHTSYTSVRVFPDGDALWQRSE